MPDFSVPEFGLFLWDRYTVGGLIFSFFFILGEAFQVGQVLSYRDVSLNDSCDYSARYRVRKDSTTCWSFLVA